jgi:hypothetical protein
MLDSRAADTISRAGLIMFFMAAFVRHMYKASQELNVHGPYKNIKRFF